MRTEKKTTDAAMLFQSSHSWAKAFHSQLTGHLKPRANTNLSCGLSRLSSTFTHPRWWRSWTARIATGECSLQGRIPPSGPGSWCWSKGPLSKQKLPEYELFDPHRELFKRGAHMPLMVYIGNSNEARRSVHATRRRNATATQRGWTWERRHQKGKQKGSGKDGKGGTRGGGKGS